MARRNRDWEGANRPIPVRFEPELEARLRAMVSRLSRTSTLPVTHERRSGEYTMSDFIRRSVIREMRKVERSRVWRRRKKELARQRASANDDGQAKAADSAAA